MVSTYILSFGQPMPHPSFPTLYYHCYSNLQLPVILHHVFFSYHTYSTVPIYYIFTFYKSRGSHVATYLERRSIVEHYITIEHSTGLIETFSSVFSHTSQVPPAFPPEFLPLLYLVVIIICLHQQLPIIKDHIQFCCGCCLFFPSPVIDIRHGNTQRFHLMCIE